MAAILGDDGPKGSALRGLPPRVERGRTGFVDNNTIGTAQMGPRLVDHRYQVETGAPKPVAERGAREVDLLTFEDFDLAIEMR